MTSTKSKFVKRYPRAVLKIRRTWPHPTVTYHILHQPGDTPYFGNLEEWAAMGGLDWLQKNAAKDVAKLRTEPS